MAIIKKDLIYVKTLAQQNFMETKLLLTANHVVQNVLHAVLLQKMLALLAIQLFT